MAKMYKGFNKDLTCTPADGVKFQYEEGKTYTEESTDLCKKGFHACEMPLNCFSYYPPAGSVYHEVDLEEVSEKRDTDSKRVGKKITIGLRLDIAGLIKAQFEWVKKQTKNEYRGGYQSALTGGYQSALTGGDQSALTGGDQSALTGGYQSALTGGRQSALTGGYQSALTGGYQSALTGGYQSALTGGDQSALTGGYQSALTGGRQSALTGGYQSALTGGDQSALTGGDRSALTGGSASVLRGGEGSRFCGGLWSVFACEIIDKLDNIVGMAVAVVDGETIKPDTWYKVENGEFVEVKE